MDENKEMQDLNQIEDAPQEQGQEPEKTENTQNTQYRYTAEQIHQDTQTSQQWGYNSQPYQQQPYQQQYQQPYQGGGQPPYGTPPYGGYYTYQPQPPKKKKSGKGAKAAVAVLCAVLTIGGAFGASVAGSYLGLSKAESNNSAILAEGGSIERTDAKELQNSTYSSVADIVEDVSHSLATIITGSGYATGAIVGEDDEYVYVATAYHILTSTNSVQLIFGEDDENVYTPELQGIDSDTDLAVLKVKKTDIDEVQRTSLKVATLGDSTGMVLGDLALTFSSPRGYYSTPSLGTISGLERSVSFTVNNTAITMDMLQTDAAVNTSGVLFNGRGEVIGFTLDMTIEDSEGIGFAIPTSTAKSVIGELIRVGYVEKPYMGFSGYDVMNFHPNNSQSSWAEYYGLPMGVLVANVNDGSPAAEAGLKVYDVIIGFNGNTINNFDDLKDWLDECEVGQTVTVEVLRGYMNGETETVELTMTLQQKPQ